MAHDKDKPWTESEEQCGGATRDQKRETPFTLISKGLTGLSQKTVANYIKNTNPQAVRTLLRRWLSVSSRGQTQEQSGGRITSLCMVFTCVGLMDRASSYQRLASSKFPLSSAICPLIYSTLWEVGKRLAASCVQAVASAGFDMLVYTSAVRNT